KILDADAYQTGEFRCAAGRCGEASAQLGARAGTIQRRQCLETIAGRADGGEGQTRGYGNAIGSRCAPAVWRDLGNERCDGRHVACEGDLEGLRRDSRGTLRCREGGRDAALPERAVDAEACRAGLSLGRELKAASKAQR